MRCVIVAGSRKKEPFQSGDHAWVGSKDCAVVAFDYNSPNACQHISPKGSFLFLAMNEKNSLCDVKESQKEIAMVLMESTLCDASSVRPFSENRSPRASAMLFKCLQRYNFVESLFYFFSMNKKQHPLCHGNK